MHTAELEKSVNYICLKVFMVILGIFIILASAHADSYEIIGPSEANPGEYINLTFKFTGEDIYAVGVIYSCDSAFESVQYFNVSDWGTCLTGSTVNRIGIADLDGYNKFHEGGEWNHLLNGTEEILSFRIKISDEVKYGDVLTFKMDTVYYATTDKLYEDVESKNLPTAEGNVYTVTIANTQVPTITNISAKSATSNTIYWNSLEGVSGYRIYRRINTSGTKWEKIYETYDGSKTSYVDSGINAGKNYVYTISSLKFDGDGNCSESAFGSELSPLAKPVLTNVNSTATNKNKITWSAVSGAESYRVYRKTSSGNWSLIGTTKSTSYTDTNCKNSTLYYYTVRAVRTNSGITAYSWYNSGMCSLTMPVLTNVNSTDTNKNIITWSAVTGASSYSVYRKTSNGSWSFIGNTKTTSYTDSNCKNSTLYYYTVRAVRTNSGITAYSWYNSGMCSLTMPTIYSINSTGQNKTIIKWNSVTGAQSYIIYRKTTNGSWKSIGTSTTTSYTDKTCSTSTFYYYTVRAVRVNSGITARSYYYSGKYSLKNPVVSLTATAKNKNTVKWSKITGANYYIVYRKTTNGTYKKIGTTTSLSYVDKTAKSGTKYYYTVRAVRTYTRNSTTYEDRSYFIGKTITTK
jgi:fibronectin type 3 domain-containing protein